MMNDCALQKEETLINVTRQIEVSTNSIPQELKTED